MEKKYFPRTSYGVAEELLIILLIKYNKFNIGYMNFKETIEVEEINKIKNSQIIFKQKIKNLENQECYLITQKKYNEGNYEILIIQNIDNKINAIFLYIGIDKNKNEIINIKNDLAKNAKNYKNGLKSLGFEVNSIYLLFLFDEETQKDNSNSSGAKICLDNKIDFLVYSFQDFSIKKTENLIEYTNLLFLIPKYEISENSTFDMI